NIGAPLTKSSSGPRHAVPPTKIEGTSPGLAPSTCWPGHLLGDQNVSRFEARRPLSDRPRLRWWLPMQYRKACTGIGTQPDPLTGGRPRSIMIRVIHYCVLFLARR